MKYSCILRHSECYIDLCYDYWKIFDIGCETVKFTIKYEDSTLLICEWCKESLFLTRRFTSFAFKVVSNAIVIHAIRVEKLERQVYVRKF